MRWVVEPPPIPSPSGRRLRAATGTPGIRPAGEARYDEEAIAHLLAEIRAHNESWRAWFDANGVSPLDVRYEALAADPDREARRVLDFLGVEAPAERLVPRMRRIGDAVNANWAARFRAVP